MSTTQRHGLLKSSQLLVQQEYSLTLGDVNLPDSVFPTQTEGLFSQIQSTEYGFTNYIEGEFTFTRGHKQYELSNHLGNVLVTIQDRKWGRQNAPQTNCDYYLSYVVTITDYHAFGSTITERSATFGGGYRFGFNKQEKEVELGDGVTTAEFWMYYGKLGRRWNVDPKPIHVHEVLHFAITFPCNQFIGEGLASYYGGIGAKPYDENKDEVLDMLKRKKTSTFSSAMQLWRTEPQFNALRATYVMAAIILERVKSDFNLDTYRNFVRHCRTDEEMINSLMALYEIKTEEEVFRHLFLK